MKTRELAPEEIEYIKYMVESSDIMKDWPPFPFNGPEEEQEEREK